MLTVVSINHSGHPTGGWTDNNTTSIMPPSKHPEQHLSRKEVHVVVNLPLIPYPSKQSISTLSSMSRIKKPALYTPSGWPWGQSGMSQTRGSLSLLH